MATLTIDTNDSPSVMRLAATFLNDVADDVEGVVTAPAPIAQHPDDVPQSDIKVNDKEVSLDRVSETPAPAPDARVAGQEALAEVDSSGRIWDARIDSSSKATNANGTWKARRNVPKETRAEVLDELLGKIPVATPGVVAAPPVAQPPSDAVAVFGGAPTAAEPEQLTWPVLLGKVTKAFTAGTLTQDTSEAWLNANGVKKFPLLATRPDLFEAYIAAMGL